MLDAFHVIQSIDGELHSSHIGNNNKDMSAFNRTLALYS